MKAARETILCNFLWLPLNKSWHKYNESLIERGRILMDIGF